VIGRLLGRIFGPREPRRVVGEEVIYGRYRITPTPFEQGGRWITAGIIVLETEQGRREYRFVRADSHLTPEDALRFSVLKARQMIDQLGERVFDLPG